MPPRSGWLSAGVYAVAIALCVIPVVDVLSQVWPVRLSLAEWRYGTLGLTSNYFLTPILGLVLAGAAAFWLGQRRSHRTVAVIAIAGAAMMVIALVAFALDVLQLKEQVTPEALPMFRAGALKAGFKLAVYAVCLALLGVGFWKTGSART